MTWPCYIQNHVIMRRYKGTALYHKSPSHPKIWTTLALHLVCTVCPGLPIRKLRTFTVLKFSFGFENIESKSSKSKKNIRRPSICCTSKLFIALNCEDLYKYRCMQNKIGSAIFEILDIWAASSVFGTYRLCEQRRFRRACASAQSRQNLRCSLIQAVSQEEPSDRKPDPWPLWMTGHAQLKFVMTECSKTQICLMRPI